MQHCKILGKGGGFDRLEDLVDFERGNFSRVFDHISSCSKCDLQELGELYKDRLRHRPEGWQHLISGSICRNLMKIERVANQRGVPYDPGLTNYFLSICLSTDIVFKNEDRLSYQEIHNFVQSKLSYHVKQSGKQSGKRMNPTSEPHRRAMLNVIRRDGERRKVDMAFSKLEGVLDIYNSLKPGMSNEEIRKMIRVVRVHSM